MNKVILIGRLSDNPNVYQAQNSTVAKYTLAVDRPRKKDGQQETDWPRCVCFGKNAEFASKYLTKGTKIAIEGRIQTGSYEKDGVKHFTTDIIVDRHEFCESKKSSPDYGGGYQAPAPSYDGYNGLPGDFTEMGDDDGELPF